jgi:glyoxylase-like metal-dependent hydrolase (beta-lactamase superfamily II)
MTIRTVIASNPSAMTLDGTRTHIVGNGRVVIIDPGPKEKKHLHAVYAVVRATPVNAILLTHTHPDHAAGAELFAEAFDAPVLAYEYGNLADNETLPTDEGEVLALHTPGHTGDSVSFEVGTGADRVIFCGDLMMGGLDTALVARPEGNLGRYLQSLDRIRDRNPSRIIPTHGPEFDDPIAAIDRYRQHRVERLEQVYDAMMAGATDARSVVDRVYGEFIDAALREYAEGAIEAYLHHLRDTGRLPMPGGDAV